MAGKQPSKEQIRVALGIYLANTPGIQSAYDEATDCYHLKDANGKEATIGPGWHCEDGTLRDAVGGILMDMLQSEPDHASAPKQAQKPAERVNVPASQRSGQIPPQGKALAGLTAQDIINYINPKATEQEAYLFAEFCRRKGADPMTKQVYLAIFENEKGDRNVSFIAGKEYFTEKAEAHPQFDGMKAGIIVRQKEGKELEHREGTFYLPSEEILLGGWAEVFRKDRKISTKAEVVLAEYNTGKRNWAKMPGTMIRKVAIVQALRESFPQNLGGMYDRSEMDQAGALVPIEVQG